MIVEMDPDLQRVAEFMQANFEASKLVPIAQGLSAISPLLWGRYGEVEIRTLELVNCSEARSESEPAISTQSA